MSPKNFFQRTYTTKSGVISEWYSSLRASLPLSTDPKLVELAITRKRSMIDSLLAFLRKKRFVKNVCDVSYPRFICPKFFTFCQTSDKVLTKKQAERSELLPEETGRRNLVSTEYFDIDVRGFHDSCSSTSDPSSKPNLEEDIESEYYDFRKRHKFFIHGKMQFIKLMPEEILKRM
ncbi:1720_t:CDS:2 [Rhizophagus irregularis]|nr:1720_t:CDS:2 [Rhizophagus irregularis]